MGMEQESIGGLAGVVDDTSPQLSNDLDGQGNYLVDVQNISDLNSKGRGYYFSGIGGKVTISNNSIIDLGTSEFSIVINLCTEEILTDVIGGIIKKYDGSGKQGFTFSMTDKGQLNFGMDNNKSAVAQTEVAPQLGTEELIYGVTVYNGKLYGGTDPNGKLYEWNGANAWVEVAPQLGAEVRVYNLTVYNGKLYGGTRPGGKLYEWNGTNAWTEVAPQLGDAENVYNLAVYNGKLYGGTRPGGKLYEWNGVDAWAEVAPQLGVEKYVCDLVVYNGKLYGATGDHGKLYEWNGVDAWIEVAPQFGTELYLYGLVVYNGKLYCGTGPNGKLYEWNGTNAWTEVAPKLGTELYMYSLTVYNGKLYCGTRPNGKLYEWNGTNAWTEVAPQLGAEELYGIIVYNGKLYGGTRPGGKLYEWETGKVVVDNHQFNPGSKQVTLVKDNTSLTLKLFVEGFLVAESSTFIKADYDLSNTEDLLIGADFNGQMSEVKLYNKALSETEIIALFSGALVPHKYTKASQIPLTSGVLVVGKQYIIDTFAPGDDFLNVNGLNVTGNVFTAVGVTPTVWTNGSSLRQIGCVLQLDQSGIGHTQWLDNSGNELHGVVEGVLPLNLPADNTERFRHTIAITDDTTFANVVPAGYELKRIIFVESAGFAATIDLGTVATGSDVFVNQVVAASSITTLVVNQTFSMTIAQSLFLNDDDAGSSWNGASITATLLMRRLI